MLCKKEVLNLGDYGYGSNDIRHHVILDCFEEVRIQDALAAASNDNFQRL